MPTGARARCTRSAPPCGVGRTCASSAAGLSICLVRHDLLPSAEIRRRLLRPGWRRGSGRGRGRAALPRYRPGSRVTLGPGHRSSTVSPARDYPTSAASRLAQLSSADLVTECTRHGGRRTRRLPPGAPSTPPGSPSRARPRAAAPRARAATNLIAARGASRSRGRPGTPWRSRPAGAVPEPWCDPGRAPVSASVRHRDAARRLPGPLRALRPRSAAPRRPPRRSRPP